jgi:hypothetical protein
MPDVSFDDLIPKKPEQKDVSFDDLIPQDKKSNVPEGPLSLGQALGYGLRNYPSDLFGSVLPAIGHAIVHPIETAEDLYHAVRGGALGLEDIYREKLGIAPLPVDKDAEAMKQYVEQNYGSWDNYKRYFAEHPAQALGDLSMVLGGGEAAVGQVGNVLRAAGAPAKIVEAADITAKGLKTASTATNPLTPVVKPISMAAGQVIDRINVPRELSDVEKAQQRTAAAGMPVDVPRFIQTENPVTKAAALGISKFPIVNQPLITAAENVPKQIGSHIENLAEQSSQRLPLDVVGGGISQTLGGAAEREAATAEATAQANLAAERQRWEQATQARKQAVDERHQQATDLTSRTFGDVSPIQAARDTIRDVQNAHQQAADQRTALYNDVNNLDASVSTAAFPSLGQRAERALVDAGFDIDNPGSNAATMLDELRRLSGRPGEVPPNVPPRVLNSLRATYGDEIPAHAFEALGYPGASEPVPPNFRMLGAHAPPPGADSITVQGLEHLSKRIGRMGMNAQTPADQAASAIVKRAFEDWRNDAFDSHLTPDSAPNAREVIDAARAAHRDLMERYGYNYLRQPAGSEAREAQRTLNQIVTGSTTPEAVRDDLIGHKPGNRPGSAPLYQAIGNAVPNPDQLRTRWRGAYWNAMQGDINPVTGRPNPATLRRNVQGLAPPGEPPTTMGAHLFTPQDLQLAHDYAAFTEQVPQHLKQIDREAAATEPKLARVEPGPAQQTAKDFLGNRSYEQVFHAFDSALKKGKTAASREAIDAWRTMSDVNKAEFRGAWLRNLGGGGEQFDLGKFVKNWSSYSDALKGMVVGNEQHLQHLNDFHKQAEEFVDAVSKYGNPSGTGQITMWHKLLTGGLALGGAIVAGNHPAAAIGSAMATLAGGLGLYGVSKLLATPRGAAELVKWNRTAKAYQRAPTAAKLNALSTSTRLLQNMKDQGQ